MSIKEKLQARLDTPQPDINRRYVLVTRREVEQAIERIIYLEKSLQYLRKARHWRRA